MRWVAPSEKDTANETLEKRLWAAADQFRANSGLKAGQYSTEKNATRADLEARMRKRLMAFADEAQQFRRARFVDPILETVQILPKDELVGMAEALVSCNRPNCAFRWKRRSLPT
jgi:hypothetical protein